jgi:hypothetical protein
LYLYFATQYFLGVRHQTPGSALSRVWSSYRTKSGTAQLGIALVTTLVLLSFVGLTSAFAVIDRESALTSSAITPTTAPTLVLEVTETPTQPATLLNPTDTPTATPPAASQLLCHTDIREAWDLITELLLMREKIKWEDMSAQMIAHLTQLSGRDQLI